MPTRISDMCFPGLNYNMVVTMPDHLCNILLEGSSDLCLSENRNLFELVFDFIKKNWVFICNMMILHLMSALMEVVRWCEGAG